MPQTQINHADIRTRFIFDDMPVRGLHVRLENVWKHIVGQKHYPPAIRRALGELLAAGALLSGNLKTDGTLIVQVQGQGRLKMLVVEATSDQTVRATARWDETADINDDESLTDLLGGNSVFVLTLQPKDARTLAGGRPARRRQHRPNAYQLHQTLRTARYPNRPCLIRRCLRRTFGATPA